MNMHTEGKKLGTICREHMVVERSDNPIS